MSAHGVGKSHLKCKSGTFDLAVTTILDDFETDVYMAVYLAIKETAEEVVRLLKSAGEFKGTKYRKSWKADVTQRRLYTTAVVHNVKHYRLTHLLEFGHVLKVGGRTIGEVRPFPHIAEINDKTGEMFEEKLKDYIGDTDRL